MKFYMTPGSCSTGIHILLEELELPFAAYILNLPAGDHRKPEYLALNPKATIPTLVLDDDTAITEFAAIAYWLARKYPKAGFLPDNLTDEARVIEVLTYVTGTVHGQAYTRIFTTDSYSSNPEDHPAIQARGKEMVAHCFEILDVQLAGREYVVSHFTIADAALFYVEFWAEKIGLTLPANLKAHYQRMLQRPVVRRVLAEEGYRLG